MAIQRQDTFSGRTVASGFGTASDGNVWTVASGDGQSVSTNEGRITSSSASTFATLGASLLTADGEGLIRFQVASSQNTFGILLRFTSTSNYYLARYDGAGNLAFFKNIGGTKTTVGSYAFAPGSGTFYWMRFHVSGTTISIRSWQDGTTEPGTWNYSTTDTSLSGASGGNKVGLYGFDNFGSGNSFDHFSVDDLVVGGTPVPLSGTLATQDGLSASLSTGFRFTGIVAAAPSLSASLPLHRPLTGSFAATFALSASLLAGSPGTGIGDITRTSGTQTANKSGNGYGTGDITGTEYDYIYQDATGSGWAIGANPWYGGMPASAWYQIDPGLNTTLPQRTSKTGNLMSLLTTQSGGIVHWEEAGPNGFQSSELLTFQNANHFTELAPTGTPFRAYLKAIGDASDANGISWTATMCVYPGDPGLVVFRFDQHNPTASAISVDESDIELIASLLTDSGSPAGVWKPSNGFIGAIGGSITNGWPADGVWTAGTFDFCGILPDASSGIVLGTGAAVLADPSVQFGWTQGGYEAHTTAPGTTPGRIKFGFYSDVTSNWNIPAGQTNTYYILRAFKRNLTSAVMAAIAADFKYPGTPTTAAGSFTTFSVDERAYVFAASGNALSATLDFSPVHVSVRYKPVYKITGWTAGQPAVSWGGVTLTAGTDYRYTVDAANQVLYLQLYADVVPSGAGAGQRNNAALTVQNAVIRLSGAIPSGSGVSSSPLRITRSLTVATSPAIPSLSGALPLVRHLTASVVSGASLSGVFLRRGALAANLPTAAAFSPLALHIGRPLATALSGALAPVATLSSTRVLSVHLASGSALSATLTTSTGGLAALLPSASQVRGSLRIGRPLHAQLPSSATLAGSLPIRGQLSGALTVQPGFTAHLFHANRLHVSVPAPATTLTGALSVAKLQATLPSSAALAVSILIVKRPLTAGLSTTASVGGSLLASRRLHATVGPASALSATLSRSVPLSATLPATPVLSATIALAYTLHASLDGHATLSGRLTVSRLHGSLDAQPGFAPQPLLLVRRITSTLSSGAGLHATLSLGQPTLPLQGNLPSGAALPSPHLTVRRVFHLATLSGHTIQAALPIPRALSASVPSSTALSGVCTRTAALAPQVPSHALLTAQMVVARRLTVALPLACAFSGSLRLSSNLPPQVLMLLLSESTNGLALDLSDTSAV